MSSAATCDRIKLTIPVGTSAVDAVREWLGHPPGTAESSSACPRISSQLQLLSAHIAQSSVRHMVTAAALCHSTRRLWCLAGSI
jgi:hypothetical protein